jgi:hypothetical protein
LRDYQVAASGEPDVAIVLGLEHYVSGNKEQAPMSYLIATPEMMAAAATDVAAIGSSLSEANAAAAAPTMGVLAAGADDVSAAIASMFTQHAAAYQGLSAQATAFHAQFVQTLHSAEAAYANTEIANVQQCLLNAINTPAHAMTGRPLIGTGGGGF